MKDIILDEVVEHVRKCLRRSQKAREDMERLRDEYNAYFAGGQSREGAGKILEIINERTMESCGH